MSNFPTRRLDMLASEGIVLLGRGDIISRDDISACPGPYPIYSSSASNDGKFGEYGKFMFDEELITWSVDGGGKFFYRGKHKYSVTNVCGYMRVKSDLLDPRFLYYVLADQHRHLTFDYTTKAHPSVIKKQYWVPDVDLRLQRKIARIIASIDGAIEKTESLIEKYQHIKAGLMHDLFTRGVLPNGQLRPRREEAPELYSETSLGTLPKDWLVVHLGQMAQIVSGVTLNEKKTQPGWVEVPYLRVANVQDGYLNLSSVKTVFVPPGEAESLRLYPGDVLMNEGGDFDKLGRGSVWSGELKNCIHQNHVFRVRVSAERILPWYLAYHSESIIGKKYFLRSSKQSTNLASINSSQLHSYPIACPSVDEQSRIVEKLHALKRQITALRQAADCLQAQKSGLMQDLLTGKVPVPVPEHEATDG